MASSGAKNGILVVIILVALGAAAIIAGPKMLGPSKVDQIGSIRERGDAFTRHMGRKFATDENPARFGRVSIQLNFDDDADEMEKTAKFVISGRTPTAADKAAVEAFVREGNPPFPVEWTLEIDKGT
ncbi:MAG: hypothetical protein ACT4PL_00880 [Phycisphaerales bacterium]